MTTNIAKEVERIVAEVDDTTACMTRTHQKEFLDMLISELECCLEALSED